MNPRAPWSCDQSRDCDLEPSRLVRSDVLRVTRSEHAKVECACPLKFQEIGVLGIISDYEISTEINENCKGFL